MANETIKPGYAFKEDVGTANYEDNELVVEGSAMNHMKIINDGAANLEFIINRANDSAKVDGIVKAGEEISFDGLEVGKISVKGVSAYRLWLYQ